MSNLYYYLIVRYICNLNKYSNIFNIPLKPTKFGENLSNRISAEDVWNPDSNSIDFPVELLSKIKSKYLTKNSLTEALFFDE